MVCKLLPHNSLSLRIILFSPAVGADDVYDSRIFFRTTGNLLRSDNAARRSSTAFFGCDFFFFLWRAGTENCLHIFSKCAILCRTLMEATFRVSVCDKTSDNGTESPRPPADADKAPRKKNSCTFEPPTNAQNVGAEKM